MQNSKEWGGVSLLNQGKGRGLWAKCPVLFLHHRAGKQGSGEGSAAAADSAALGHGGGRGDGEKEPGVRWLDSPTWLDLRWSEAAGLRERAAAATGVRRGGAAAEERRAVGVSEVGMEGAELRGTPWPFL